MSRRSGNEMQRAHAKSKQALNTFEFSESEEAGIIGLISAVLNLGNIAFQKGKVGVSSAQLTPESSVFLTRAAKLLQVRQLLADHSLARWLGHAARLHSVCRRSHPTPPPHTGPPA